MSWTLTRRRAPLTRTPPSRTYRTWSRLPISRGTISFPLKLNADDRAATCSPSIRRSAVVISSDIPSLNGSLPESSPIFLNTSTATEGTDAPDGLKGSRRTRNAYPAISTVAVTATSVDMITARRCQRARRRGGGAAPVSASRKATALANRSAGSLASAVVTICSSAAGTSARIFRSDGTGSEVWCASTAWALAPVNGGAPASIS